MFRQERNMEKQANRLLLPSCCQPILCLCPAAHLSPAFQLLLYSECC